MAQNAVPQTSIDEVALDREVVVGTDTTVSNLSDDWSVTNQKKSGRCWLFAGLNLLRVGAAQAMNLEESELSQSHPIFWDEFVRANFFLEAEAMIETADRDFDDRTVAFLLGFWTMNDDWFDEHVFEIAARRDQLPPERLVALEAEPIMLRAWDSTGSLAR